MTDNTLDKEIENYFYMSFADATLPSGKQFLGGAYIKGNTLQEALARSHFLHINPGGEVQAVGPFNKSKIPKHHTIEKLLSKKEVLR